MEKCQETESLYLMEVAISSRKKIIRLFFNYTKDSYSTKFRYISLTGLVTNKGRFVQSYIDGQIGLNESR